MPKRYTKTKDAKLYISKKEKAYVNSKICQLWTGLGDNLSKQSQHVSEYGKDQRVSCDCWVLEEISMHFE